MPLASRVLTLVAGTLLATAAACNFVFSLEGYEGRQEPGGDAGQSCPHAAAFCDDFERSPDDLQGSWTTVAANGGELSIVPGAPTGNALRCRLLAGDSVANAYLETTTTAEVTQRATVSSRVRVSSPANTGSINLNRLAFYGAGSPSLVFAIVQGNGLVAVGEVVCDGGCSYAQTQPVAFVADTWFALSLSVDFTKTPATYTLKIDDATVIDAAPSTLGVQPGALQFRSGIESSEPHGDFEMLIDDVALEVE
jgi:hypothetical protein